MTNKQRIERLENVVGKLIAWSASDLGVAACSSLLNELGSDAPKIENNSREQADDFLE